jgi:Protein of unknown function (DUF1593)
MNKILLLIGFGFIFFATGKAKENPRVFIFTDINIDSGDPDDRQSLIHLLWYANELQIEGIVPDRWNAKSVEACELVIDAYSRDYLKFSFDKKNYPIPDDLRKIVANNMDESFRLFGSAVSDTRSPLYVLVWGTMGSLSKILLAHPEYSKNIRLITIGTGLMLEEDIKHMPPDWEKSKPCEQLNWNGSGRNVIYNNPQFNAMWWLEMNWSYSGMFTGTEPQIMFNELSRFGSLGQHIKEVVKNEAWAQYFRVGDTPSVLYVIDTNHDFDNPTQSSWAGKFSKPIPSVKPHYYTDYSGSREWDYLNPCNTWKNHKLIRDEAANTLTNRRPEMYNALLEKLKSIYTIE